MKPPRRLATIVASARRITTTRTTTTAPADNEAIWHAYDQVGELRFVTQALAGRVGQARLAVARRGDDPTQPPEPSTEGPAADLLNQLHATTDLPALLTRAAANLFLIGDGWIIGLPNSDDPEGPPEYRFASTGEVARSGQDLLIHLDHTPLRMRADQVVAVRVWREHPHRSWMPDSPVRSSLPVLRELIGLTQHVAAQVDSRLAGAGILLVPQSAQRALRAAGALDLDDPHDDPFTEALLEAMLQPLKDRDSASAVAPLVVTVPDDAVPGFRHITFATPLDGEARELRDESIRRLALGLDMPPEVLLGVASMNHWGAWQVAEEVLTVHVQPPLDLICQGLTEAVLVPGLEAAGMDPAEASRWVIVGSVDHLAARPADVGSAMQLHAAGLVDGATVREVAGYGDDDAPQADAARVLVARWVAADPGLIVTPGVGALLDAARLLTDGGAPTEPVPEPVAEAPADGPPGVAP